jgi:alkanesulfonate monooxygenase SsuD/methylene tetrahydromethanopterin reductase-like flavin-dependent oxidoreductase (luciferase family)
MGAPELSPGESIEALEEAIEIMRESWNGAHSIRHQGPHYQLDGMKPGPTPAHPIGIWVGAAKPRALALTGRLADGWVAPMMVYVPPAEVPAAQERIDRAARDAGRDPAAIKRIYIVSGEFTSEEPGPGSDSDPTIIGPPDHWVEVLTHFAVDLGLSSLILAAPPDPDTLRIYIEQVAPAVRERVAAARG